MTLVATSGTEFDGYVDFTVPSSGVDLGTVETFNEPASLTVPVSEISTVPGPVTIDATFTNVNRKYGETGQSTATTTLSIQPRVLPSTSLAASANPAIAGQPVTFTATVNAPAREPTATGTVSFSQTSLTTGAQNVLATVALNGSGVASYTTSTLAAGANPISANYNGDTNYYPDQSLELDEQIQPAPTTTTLKFNPDPVTVGQSYTVTANVASTTGQAPTGTVTFYSEGAEVSTIALNASDPVSPRSPHRRRLLRAR